MDWAALETVWPVLALLGYTLATSVLYVLAAQRRHHLEIYDRIRASKQLRREYLQALASRQRSGG
jgi:hypothetical protein